MKTFHSQLSGSQTSKSSPLTTESRLRSAGPLGLRGMALAAGATAALLFGNGCLLANPMDDKIEAAAKSSYVFKTYLAEDSVKLDAQEGRVTLTGSVRQESHKLLAQETVAGLPGVSSVDNQIKLREPQTENSDTWLALKVKSALAFHRGVSAFGTEVKVVHGVVTLSGEASSEAQRELAKEYAEDIEGVKEVNNEIKVASEKANPAKRSEEAIDDASITAQVRVALLTHRSTRSSQINVATNEGIVTLKGNARNKSEKALIAKLVEDIHGVKEVVNKISVDEETLDN